MTPDFRNFTQSYSRNWLWYSPELAEKDVLTAPLGTRFTCLYAPVFNLKKWTLTRFEIRMYFDAVLKRNMRCYFDIGTTELEQAPFDWHPFDLCQKELDTPLAEHPEWPDYLDGKQVSEQFQARLKAELVSAA